MTFDQVDFVTVVWITTKGRTARGRTLGIEGNGGLPSQQPAHLEKALTVFQIGSNRVYTRRLSYGKIS